MAIQSKVHAVCSAILLFQLNAFAQVDLPHEAQGEEEYASAPTPKPAEKHEEQKPTAQKAPESHGGEEHATQSTEEHSAPTIEHEGTEASESSEGHEEAVAHESENHSTSQKGYIWFGVVFVVLLALVFALT